MNAPDNEQRPPSREAAAQEHRASDNTRVATEPVGSQLRRRRWASLRLPVMEDGLRDPLSRVWSDTPARSSQTFTSAVFKDVKDDDLPQHTSLSRCSPCGSLTVPQAIAYGQRGTCPSRARRRRELVRG